MDAERQAVAFGGGVDRPQVAPAERRFLHGENEDLHKAAVLGATLDLVDGVFGVLHRQHDRRPQARIAIEPFLHDPVVERAREGRGHVLAEQQTHAIQAIADRDARLPAIAHLRRELRCRGGGAAILAAPLRPRRERRIGRIGDGLERIDAALLHRLAPKVVEIGQQRLHVRHGRMHVAIDGVKRAAHGCLVADAEIDCAAPRRVGKGARWRDCASTSVVVRAVPTRSEGDLLRRPTRGHVATGHPLIGSASCQAPLPTLRCLREREHTEFAARAELIAATLSNPP